jgi:hypothetical protein
MQKVKQKGFVFSFEATISILLLLLMLFYLPETKSNSLKELLALEEANDLLRVWSITGINESEMALDLNTLFGTRAGLEINERIIVKGNAKNNSVSTEGIILNQELKEEKIRITVFLD